MTLQEHHGQVWLQDADRLSGNPAQVEAGCDSSKSRSQSSSPNVSGNGAIFLIVALCDPQATPVKMLDGSSTCMAVSGLPFAGQLRDAYGVIDDYSSDKLLYASGSWADQLRELDQFECLTG